VPVLNLLIVEPSPSLTSSEGRLIILSADNVKSIPLDNCGSAGSCESCLSLLSCAWDSDSGQCVRHREARGGLVVSQCPVIRETTTETATIVHDIEEETTTEMVEDDTDIAEDVGDEVPGSSLLSPTVSPAPDLTPRTACPACACHCPPVLPVLPDLPVLQPGSHTTLSSNGSRGGFDEVDNELDYGWQENEAPLKQEIENEKLQQVKTEPDVTSNETDDARESLPLSMAITIALVTGLASLVLGFLSGFFVSRLCSHKSSASVTSSNVSLVKPCPLDKPVNVDSGYTTPTNCDNNNSSKNINILMNGNQSKQSVSGSSKLERTKLSCTGTLQKVKRVYL